jgi:cyclopropane fatty-acyl-phospholipid synthase-like methyltransferase
LDRKAGGRRPTKPRSPLCSNWRRVLDVACGAGGPSLALAKDFGCQLTGLDIAAEGIAHASDLAHKRGLTHLADFALAYCGARLPFGGFDAILCIDAI